MKKVLIALTLACLAVGCASPAGPDGSVLDPDSGVPQDTDGGGGDDGGENGGTDGGPDGGEPMDPDAGPIVEDPPLDADGDGVPDETDLFPTNAAEFFDDDSDGVGNGADLDEDGDGVPDATDAVPFDPTRSTADVGVEVEPNYSFSTATPITARLPARITGTFLTGNDIDVVSLALPAGTPITFRLLVAAPVDDAVIDVLSANVTPLFTFEVPPGDATTAVAAVPSAAMTYALQVSARGAPADVAWTLLIDVDRDADGLFDGPERALGLHPARPDTDGDGLGDAIELAAPRDPDGDGAPTPLDPDADGDGLRDGDEPQGDADRDTLPSFVDTDSDGDGVNEAPADGGTPIDTDGDLVPDTHELDDDDDGLLDLNDPSALTPALTGDPLVVGQLALHRAWSELGTDLVPSTAVEGETLVIEGVGFNTTPGMNWVIFRGPGVVLNVRPTAATATELRLVVPARVRDTVELAVSVGGLVTRFVGLSGLSPQDPVLFPISVMVDPNAGAFSFRGRNLDGVVRADFGGTPEFPAAWQRTATTISLYIPSDRAGRSLRVGTGRRWSNRIEVETLVVQGFDLTPPPGSTLSFATALFSGGNNVETVSGTSRTLQITDDVPVLVTALAPRPSGGRCSALTSFYLPTESPPPLSTTTTAIAAGFLAARLTGPALAIASPCCPR